MYPNDSNVFFTLESDEQTLNKNNSLQDFNREVVFSMSHDIDTEFQEFVQKNYKKLTENQKRLCEKMGIPIPK